MNPNENPDALGEAAFDQLFMLLAELAGPSALGLDDTPTGLLARDFHEYNWQQAQEGLLARTSLIRVDPEPFPIPCVFRFTIDCPFKSKAGREEPVRLVPGPLRGTIRYHPKLFDSRPDEPLVAVMLDRAQAFFHPNYSRRHGFLCLGHLPPGPISLDVLLEHVYGIVTYQNRTPSHPADIEAARYFALAHDAMDGLEPVRPLY